MNIIIPAQVWAIYVVKKEMDMVLANLIEYIFKQQNLNNKIKDENNFHHLLDNEFVY